METDTRTAIGLSAHVGKEIRKRLIDLDMTQVQLAAKIGENEMWMSRRLRGTQPIDLNDLERIAAVLGVAVTDLLPVREGRVIATAGTPSSEPNSRYLRPARKPRSSRPRGRVARDPSERRPGAVHRVLAAA